MFRHQNNNLPEKRLRFKQFTSGKHTCTDNTGSLFQFRFHNHRITVHQIERILADSRCNRLYQIISCTRKITTDNHQFRIKYINQSGNMPSPASHQFLLPTQYKSKSSLFTAAIISSSVISSIFFLLFEIIEVSPFLICSIKSAAKAEPETSVSIHPFLPQ